uniref:Uncharacterized protein n=1 Tax=Kalanchoe fedtschenkoi TaxID=63787 RepID=A0A7N1A1F9_KALFE
MAIATFSLLGSHCHYAFRPASVTSPPVSVTVNTLRFRHRLAATPQNAVYEFEEPYVVDGIKEYFEGAKDLIRPDGGPPRWFSPLEGGLCSDEAPLLLYLPGT